jgi:hypothetical protein
VTAKMRSIKRKTKNPIKINVFRCLIQGSWGGCSTAILVAMFVVTFELFVVAFELFVVAFDVLLFNSEAFLGELLPVEKN